MKCNGIQVLVFVISLAMTTAMSTNELEDFSNFLKETSLLDQPLKNNPVDEDDDDVAISDHAWEESGRFEGDLILNDRQRQLIVQDIAEGLSRNGLKDSTKRWPNNEVIFYIQKEHFTGDQVQAIISGIEDLGQASCVKFRPYRKGDRDAVVVQGSRRGCFSQVGYQGGYQVLNLSGRHPVGRGCFRHGTIVHEFLHTLGFYHMQSSPDRDDYIDVVWENIVQPARHNFRKYNLFSVSDFGVGYDYDSVLHYSRKAFSSNGGDTLVPKQSGVQIGQRTGLSDKDSTKLNKMYCDADSNNFEAADDAPHTLVIKKKKTPKNKPFDGHGIGYHQGKTVVFKLPAAETYRLPESSSNPVFDYFSKAPQAMSPTLIEGFGVGKKISYSYKLPAGFQIVERNIPIHRSPAVFNRTSYERNPVTQQQNTQNEQRIPSNADIGHKSIETLEDFNEKPMIEHTTQKIYKYKPDTDYSKYYNPVNNHKHGTKTDYYLNYSPEIKSNFDKPNPEMTKLKLTRQFIEELHEPKSIHADNNNKKGRPVDHSHHNTFGNKHDTAENSKLHTVEETTLRDADSSFGYINPSTKLNEIKQIYFINPEYTSKKYLETKNDFSGLYSYPRDNVPIDPLSRAAQYTLFGELVPTAVNYTSKKDIPNQTFDTLKIREDVDELKEGTTNAPNEQSSNYENDSNDEDYSYEDYFDPTKNAPESKSSEENLSKSYEVTEKIVEHVALVTDKPFLDTTKSQDAENLEKRLPEILQRYVSYDNYDITTPYLFSKHDADEYYSKT